jgi:protein involved in polysaccharide export with SLBB domain
MRKSIILLVIIIANFLLLSTSVNAQSQDALNDLKQKVMSGQMSQEQAKQEMLRLSDKTGVSVPVSPTMQTNIDRTPKRSLFISPSYMEFSTKQAIDSVELVNISKNLIYWKIDNKSKGISLVKKAEEGKDGLIIKEKDVSYLNGELKAGERIFVSFKMDVTKEKELPEEGLSYLLTFKSSIGDTISSNIVYLPVKKKIETTYFGYDIFNSRYKVDINDIGPSSNEYIIAAGDELTLNTWGQVERTDQLTVAANGTLFIRDVGQIKVAGEKLSDVKIKLISMMSRSCSSLKSTKADPASTFLDISLQKISSFPVYVVGSVKKPGMVRVNSLSTVFSALFASGGVKEEGSLRNIEVLRDGKIIALVDLYEYLCDGSLKSDIRLSAKDVIRVPYRKSSVQIKGELNRPMIYELKAKENLSHLVSYAGGLKSTTDASIVVIDRLSPNAKYKRLRTTLKEKLGTNKDGRIIVNPIRIFDTDTVQIYALKGKTLDYATVEGAVYRNGVYAVTPEMTVSTLIEEAGGLKEEAYKDKAELVRSFADGRRTYFSLNLKDSLSLQTKVTSRDSLKIYSIIDLNELHYVESDGHLPAAGKFLYAKDMTVRDLILKSGGLEDEFYKKNTYLERADILRYNDDKVSTRVIPVRLKEILEGDEKANIKLEAGDKLLVYDITMTYTPKLVSVEGAVNKPGELELQTNMTVKDIIVQAGGFLHSADVSSVEVFRVDPFKIRSKALSTAMKIELKNGLLSSFDTRADFKLEDRDIVVVRQYPKYQYHRKVELLGEVKFPGTYTLLKEKETLKELIKRAGGLTDEAYFAATNFTRNSLQLVDTLQSDEIVEEIKYVKKRLVADFDEILRSKHNIELKKDDIIDIPKHSGIVTIEGEVYSPSIVQYRKGWSANDYIEAAGGYTFNAKKGKTIIYYPGGTAKTKRCFTGFPRVKEGCVIKVPTKETKTANYWLDLTAKISGVIASMVTTIYLVTK